MKDPRHITPAEFLIIEVLWAADRPRSVSQVLRALHPKRPLAYTTVMTLLDKMARKGSLRRVKKGKAYYYRPLVQKTQVLGYLVQEFADSYFAGQLPQLSILLGENSNPAPQRASSPAGNRKSQPPDSNISPSRATGNGDEEDLDIVLL